MKKELFVATSYHHMMTAIAKKRQNNSWMDLMISNMSTGDEYWYDILPAVKASGWFENIYYIDERKNHPPKPTRIIKTYKYEYIEEKKLLSKIEGLNLKAYDLIYLIDDKMFPASTIVRNNIPYHLLEDTKYTYQNMNKLGTSKVMKLPYREIQKVLKIFGFWHPVFGYAKCCEAIEVSSEQGLPKQLPREKVLVVDRNKMIDSIPKQDKMLLCDIFLEKKQMNALMSNKKSVLIMTSLYRRGMQFAEEQIRICKKVMDMYEDAVFFIKPHPRDNTDYSKEFHDAYILKGRFPSELLNYIDGISVDEVVSVGSTAINTCKIAKRTKYLTLADIGENIPYE